MSGRPSDLERDRLDVALAVVDRLENIIQMLGQISDGMQDVAGQLETIARAAVVIGVERMRAVVDLSIPEHLGISKPFHALVHDSGWCGYCAAPIREGGPCWHCGWQPKPVPVTEEE